MFVAKDCELNVGVIIDVKERKTINMLSGGQRPRSVVSLRGTRTRAYWLW
jgi:hypothetical protein